MTAPRRSLRAVGQGQSDRRLSTPPLADVTDAQLIAVWQQFRKTMGGVDARLAAGLSRSSTTEQSHNALVHEALAALAASPTRMLPMRELAATLGLSSGGLTKLCDRLVQAGFAYRSYSSLDRRVIFAALTDDGADYERRSTPDYARGLRTELGVLSSDQLRQIVQICDFIQQSFNRPTPRSGPSSAAPRTTRRPQLHPSAYPAATAPHRPIADQARADPQH